MKKAVLLILVFAMLVVAGCSSNDNRTFGLGAPPTPAPEPATPTPTPEPEPEPTPTPIPRATVSAHVLNPLLVDSAVANADVEVTYSDGQVVRTTTDANGYFTIEIEAIPGEIVEIEISKLRYSIESLVVTINPDGTLSYSDTVNAVVLLDTTGVTYMIDTVAVMDGFNITNSVLSPDEKYLYTVDEGTSKIYRVDIQTGIFTEIVNMPGGYYSTSMVITSDGDTLYIANYGSRTISKVTGVKDAAGPSSVTIITLAGINGVDGDVDGAGDAALFSYPTGAAITDDGDTLYVCDSGNGKIKKLTNLLSAQDASGVTVTTIAAGLNSPCDLCLSGDEDSIFVVDNYYHTVSRITGVKAATGPSGVTVTLLAGSSGVSGDVSGTAGDAARFNSPYGIFANDTGNVLFVTDQANCKIKEIHNAANAQSASEVLVTTMAGTGTFGTVDGDGNVAQFRYPWGIITNYDCTIVYITDRRYGIRRMIAREN